MRIGDNFAFHIRPPFPDPSRAGRQAIVGTYVLTAEARNLCVEVLQHLADHKAKPFGALILGGYPGVGKTHLLRYLMGLLENTEDPAWRALAPSPPYPWKPASPVSGLYLSAPAEPGADLADFLLDGVRNRRMPGWPPAATGTSLKEKDFESRLQKLISAADTPLPDLFVLDDVSRRLRAVPGHENLARELRLLEILVDYSVRSGTLVIVVGEEGDLKREMQEGGGEAADPSSRLSWRTVRLRRTNIAQVISGALASKDDQQRSRILTILHGLREKLPSLGPNLEAMADLYPIHPFVFQALFELRATFPDFPILQFVQIAIKASRTRSADRLVTLDWLLDFILPDLQKDEEFEPLIASFDEFQGSVIPRIKPEIQQNATDLLKTIMLLTVCSLRPATVATLADALLLCDERGVLPSYAFTAAILSEMEVHGGKYLVAEGSLRERKYRLARDVSGCRPGTLPEPEAFHLQMPLMLYHWFRSRFGEWKPELAKQYQRNSQSLPVTASISKGRSQGLVYFKSYYDPLWSEEDLALFDCGEIRWVLLVLDPFERFYELEVPLRELTAKAPRLVVWRPSSPTQAEVAQLQALASLMLIEQPEAPAPPRQPEEALDALQRILTGLYVQRGSFLSAAEESPADDKAGMGALERFIASRLTQGDSAGAAGSPIRVPTPPEEAPSTQEGAGAAREWASLLCGSDSLRDSNPKKARGQLIEWWATHVALDSATLATSCSALPEPFVTSRLSGDLKFYTRTLEKLEVILQHLNRGEIDLVGAMAQVAALFDGDQAQLRHWRKILEGLPGLLRWLPNFEHASEYLSGACPLGHQKLETLRKELLAAAADPARFMDAAARDAFDRNYQAFKQGYAEGYCQMHGKLLHLAEKGGGEQPAVDSVALRNLELLSGLMYTQRGHLNRVRIIGRWIRAKQCDLPVRQILDLAPRCYCNFDPSESRYLGIFVSQVNAAISEGIEYFRAVLRNCRSIIISELKDQGIDEYHSRQIAALLSRGAMIPLKPRSVEILNRVIQKHPEAFLTELRRFSSHPSGA